MPARSPLMLSIAAAILFCIGVWGLLISMVMFVALAITDWLESR